MPPGTTTLPKPPQSFNNNAFVIQNNRKTKSDSPLVIRTNKTSTEDKPRTIGTDTYNPTAAAADPDAIEAAVQENLAERQKHQREEETYEENSSWFTNLLWLFGIPPAKERSNVIALNPRQQQQQLNMVA